MATKPFTIFILLIAVISVHSLYPPEDNSSRFDDLIKWGTYKPYLFSAYTQKSKHPITVGTAFTPRLKEKGTLDEFQKNLRYRMRRESKSQYEYHNGLDFSVQYTLDEPGCTWYRTTIVKDLIEEPKGEEWHYMIDTVGVEKCEEDLITFPIPTRRKRNDLDLFTYISLENLDKNSTDTRYLVYENQGNDIIAKVYSNDSTEAQGFFRLSYMDYGPFDKTGPKTNIFQTFNCFTYGIPKNETWKIEDHLYQRLNDSLMDGISFLDPWNCAADPDSKESTLFLHQLKGRPAFHVIISYNSNKVPEPISMGTLIQKYTVRKLEFDKNLAKTFPTVNVNKFKTDLNETFQITRSAISNLLGGILYTYGTLKLNHENETAARELFTASPSRNGFPRGFLWDEGFHQQILCRYNSTLCMRMMKTWFETIEPNGWIPREQARGDEIENSFSQKGFIYQTEEESNPPSIILPLVHLIEKAFDNKTAQVEVDDILAFLGTYRVVLKSWLIWFVETQKNVDKDVLEEGQVFFKWNCKAPCNGKYMGSGLDDYPRHPKHGTAVGHVDLTSWVLIFSHTIHTIETIFGENTTELIDLQQGAFLTLTAHIDNKTALLKDIYTDYLRRGNKTLKYHHTLGYVNLFPLFFNIIPADSPEMHMAKLLMTVDGHLWTEHGIRSLSMSDPNFMQGDKYWTEPIWLPINYMLLRGLRLYYYKDPEMRQIYEALRENLMDTISLNWRKSRELWENYDSFTGAGKGFRGFTGWTALITLIYSEKY
jgi:mannosyl-oligosaccharide glucosidase